MTAVPGPSRRAVLAGALTVALAAATGCTSDTEPRRGRRTLTVGPTPAPSQDGRDVARVVRAIADEERLEHYCAAMSRRHRSTRSFVRPLESRQREHVRTLRGILTNDRPDPVTASPRVPATERAAVRELVRMLTAARDGRLDDCVAVSSGLLARVLGSAAASHACSLAALEGPS